MTHSPNGSAGSLLYEHDRLLNIEEAARFLSVSTALLDKWRSQGGGPRYAKLGTRRVAYRLSDLNRFIEAGLSNSNSGEA